MKTAVRRLLLLVAVVAIPCGSFAQSVELLIPVEAQEAQRVIDANHQFVEQCRYLSKRVRLVKVNTEVLLSKADQITISPFNDVSILVNRTDLTMHSGDLGFSWNGTYSSRPFSRNNFVNEQTGLGIDSKSANRMYNNFFSITIAGAKYVLDEDTGQTAPLGGMRIDTTTGRIRYESEKFKDRTTVSEFYEISFDIQPPSQASSNARTGETLFPSRFLLMSLPVDRRYHIICEADARKAVPTGKVDAATDPEGAEKVRRYREFVQSLRADPKADAKATEDQQ